MTLKKPKAVRLPAKPVATDKKSLAISTMTIEAMIRAVLNRACSEVSPDPAVQFEVAGGVIAHLLRGYANAAVDKDAYLEKLIRHVLT